MKINFLKLSGEWFNNTLIPYLSNRFPMSEEKAKKIRRQYIRYGEFLYRRKNSKWKWVSRYHTNLIKSVDNGTEAVEKMHKEYLKLNPKK